MPAGPPLDTALALLHHGRPLKRWRYVGVFAQEVMACAAIVHVGPARQSFWALYEREPQRLRERTRRLPRSRRLELSGGVAAGEDSAHHSGRLLIDDGGVRLELELFEERGWEARCANGRSHVWTRKQAGIAARGTLALDGAPVRALEALAVVDDTAGYHSRRTEWWWSAGVGRTVGGDAVAWNLVAGVNDPPQGSERAVWIAGKPREAPPVSFAADLRKITCADGAELRFAAEAQRSRRDDLVIFRSDYRAPFGSFSGTLPGGVELAHGLGVVEHHRALW
jgi:hypothetical protein